MGVNEVLNKLELVQQQGMHLWRDILYVSLQACNNISAGRRLHSLMVISCFNALAVLGDRLIRLFGSCQSLLEANIVFCGTEQPSEYTWQSIIWTHVILEEHCRAFELYIQMQQQHGLKPGKHTISCILKSCGAFSVAWKGMLIHEEVIRDELDTDIVVGSCLIDMYVKCGCLREACNVFNSLPNRNEVTWNVMIAGYVELGHCLSALRLFQIMQQDGLKPGKVTYLCILKVCQNKARALLWGRQLHNLIIRDGLELDIEVGSALVDIYARCGSMEEAGVLFVRMPTKNAVVWGAIISGYAQHGHGHLAVQFYKEMQRAGLKPDQVLFSCVLKGIASKEAIDEGMQLHNQVIIYGLDLDVVLGGSLIDMYANCGRPDSSLKVFSVLPNQNVVTWSSLIGAYSRHGDGSSVIQLFEEMQGRGFIPDKVTFVSVLQSFGGMLGAAIRCRLVHSQIVELGYDCDVVVACSLVKMCIEHGSLRDALNVFERSSSQQALDAWSELISACAELGFDQLALDLFQRMQVEGIKAEKDALVSILKSCGSLGALSMGRMVQQQMVGNHYANDVVLGNALLDMFTKCGALQEAHDVFYTMSIKDAVSWVVMMTGYNHWGHGHHALEFFEKMQQQGLKLDTVAFSCALKACCSIGLLDQGRVLHDRFIRSGLHFDSVAGNTLVDLYAKCGRLRDARKVFDGLPNHNEVSWNSLIAGYADHGMLQLARQCLFDMESHDLKPSASTYNSMFAACSHAGQIEDGWKFFKYMTENHHVTPTRQHFNGMVDILARAGYLQEAEELLHVIPNLPDTPGWTSLLTACNVHSNWKVGQQCYEELGLLDASSVSGDGCTS